MNELLALSKLSIVQHQRLVKCLLVLFAASVAFVGMLRMANGYGLYTAIHWHQAAAFFSFFVLIPCGLAGAICFDFSHGSDLGDSQSGCSHWRLRSPVPTWKIAFIPAVLKTAWMSGVWLIAAIVSQNVFSHRVPVIAPIFFLSASVIALTAIAWKPMSQGWYRVLLLAVLLVTTYLLAALVFGGPTVEKQQWQIPLRWAGLGLSVSVYVFANWGLFNACKRARTNPLGASAGHAPKDSRLTLRSQKATIGDTRTASPPTSDRPRKFKHAKRMLIWHEWEKRKPWLMRSIVLGAIPATLFFGLVLSLGPASLFMLFFAFAYIAGFAAGGTGEGKPASSTPLPPLIALSPFSSARLAWASFVVSGRIVIAMFAWIIVVYALWLLYPSNRSQLHEWALRYFAPVDGQGVPSDPESSFIGLRLLTALTLVCVTFFASRIASLWWVSLAGRPWFSTTMLFGSLALYSTPFCIALGWFIRQADWDSVQQNGAQALQWIPVLAVTALALKSLAVLATTFLLIRRGKTSGYSIASRQAAWGLGVVSVATAVALLIPHPQVTWLNCVVAAALTVPLARIQAMPLTLAWNRHR